MHYFSRLGLFLICFLPLTAAARLSCVTFLSPVQSSISQQITQYQLELSSKRKSLEEQIFKSYGNISPGLERALYNVFNHPQNREHREQAFKTLESSPLTSSMDPSTHVKIISLMQNKAVRPYMALLIARYIEQIEYKRGIFSDKAMLSTIEVVNSFIIERALIETNKTLLNNKDRVLEIEVLEFLTHKVSYKPNFINYNKPDGRLILSNVVLGHIQTIENLIAYRPWPQDYIRP